MLTLENYQEAANRIRLQTSHQPTLGIVLGSGLSSLADAISDADIIDYSDIPHWPCSTVEGHNGRLVIGNLQGHSVLVMQGRVHSYEGYTSQQITLPIRVMKLLGIEIVIVTNAAGGINPTYQAGDLMLITDHVNWAGMAGLNPLKGKNIEQFGGRFPDMTFPYDPDLCQLARDVATEQGQSIQEGVYAFVSGPNFETPAEIRLLHKLGIDAVGMSTVPTVIVARHAKMRVLGISSITNVAPHNPPPDHMTTHEEVIETGMLIVPRLMKLLEGILRKL